MSYNLPNLPTNFDSKRNKILWDNILYAMAQIARRKYANQPKELNAAINAINNTRNQLGRIDDAKLLAATDALMNQLGGSEKKI